MYVSHDPGLLLNTLKKWTYSLGLVSLGFCQSLGITHHRLVCFNHGMWEPWRMWVGDVQRDARSQRIREFLLPSTDPPSDPM